MDNICKIPWIIYHRFVIGFIVHTKMDISNGDNVSIGPNGHRWISFLFSNMSIGRPMDTMDRNHIAYDPFAKIRIPVDFLKF